MVFVSEAQGLAECVACGKLPGVAGAEYRLSQVGKGKMVSLSHQSQINYNNISYHLLSLLYARYFTDF